MTREEIITNCKARSDLFRNIRSFLSQKDFLEADTPVLSTNLIPEPTIENFSTVFDNGYNKKRQLYMIPSPEVFIKQLISKNIGSVFEFSKCFRNAEQIGKIHNPEFTMLEYYTMDSDENDNIALTEEMIAKTAIPGTPDFVLAPFKKISVHDAMYTYAEKTDLDKLQNPAKLREKARSLGLPSIPSSESWEDTFNRIFINFVEPGLPKDRPIFLDRYPQQINCLAVREGNYRRRWELYIGGIEVANCYLEETDKEIISDYYRKEYAVLCSQRGITGTVIPDINPSFPDFFTSDYPKCSGVAMGMDRLLQLEMRKKDIGGVILFPFSDMILTN